MQPSSIFNSAINKNLKTNVFQKKKKYDTIDFSPALKSIDISQEFFVNFFSSNQTEIYKELKNLYEQSLNGNLDLDKHFRSSDYSDNNQDKNNRLRMFVLYTSETLLYDSDFIGMIKYKHIRYKEFQLFIKSGKVYLIDIYHLAIPTEIRAINQRMVDPKEHYDRIIAKIKSPCCLSTMKSIIDH